MIKLYSQFETSGLLHSNKVQNLRSQNDHDHDFFWQLLGKYKVMA